MNLEKAFEPQRNAEIAKQEGFLRTALFIHQVSLEGHLHCSLLSSLHRNTSKSITSEKIFLAARERKDRKEEDQKSLRSFAANQLLSFG